MNRSHLIIYSLRRQFALFKPRSISITCISKHNFVQFGTSPGALFSTIYIYLYNRVDLGIKFTSSCEYLVYNEQHEDFITDGDKLFMVFGPNIVFVLMKMGFCTLIKCKQVIKPSTVIALIAIITILVTLIGKNIDRTVLLVLVHS